MQLEEMSDGHLNAILTASVQKLEGYLYYPSEGLLLKSNEMGHVTSQIKPKPYCTNWQCAMPLAVEHGISMMKTNDKGYGEIWVCGKANFVDGIWKFDKSITGRCVDFEADDVNPLRAIVICLIKMLEAKQCQ